MEAASAGLIGLIGGVVIGRNWKRIKRGLSWLGDRVKEELDALARPIEEGLAEYDHTGQLICEYVFIYSSMGGYHVRVDRYGNPISDDVPNTLF